MTTKEAEAREAGSIRLAGSPEDLDLAVDLLKANGIREIAKQQEDEPGSVRLLIRDGKAVGAIVHRRETWKIGSAKLKVARLWECSGETGDSSFRITGDRSLFDELVADWIGHLGANGYHLAYAHGELALWPVHGFFPSFYHPRVYVPTAKALRLKKHYKVRGVKTSDAKPMRRLMTANTHLRPRVFATGVPNFHHHVVEGPGRRVLGYFSLSVNEDPRLPPVFIPEVEVVNREAAETVLAHAAPLARDRGMKALHFALAAEHPFASACLDLGGYHQLRGTTRDITLDEEMVRVVDVRACLAAIRADLTGRWKRAQLDKKTDGFVLDVDGDRASLKWDGESVIVAEPEDELPSIKIGRWVFTQLFMGYRTATGLRAGALKSVTARKVLDSLFPRTWPLSLCDHDLWDPSLRDETKYSEAALEQIRKLRYAF